jgi:hypothetical protein
MQKCAEYRDSALTGYRSVPLSAETHDRLGKPFMKLFCYLAGLLVGQGKGAFIKRQSWNKTVQHIHISPFIMQV